MENPKEASHASLDFLNARRDWVLAAPKNNAPIITLCVRPAEGERSFVNTMTSTQSKALSVIVGYEKRGSTCQTANPIHAYKFAYSAPAFSNSFMAKRET